MNASSKSESKLSDELSAKPLAVSVPPKRSSSNSPSVLGSLPAASADSVKLSSSRKSVKSSCSSISMLSGCRRISSETNGCPPKVLSSSSRSPSNRSARLVSSSEPTAGPVTFTVASNASKDSSTLSSVSALRLSADSSDGISLKSKSKLTRLIAGSSSMSVCVSSVEAESSGAESSGAESSGTESAACSND